MSTIFAVSTATALTELNGGRFTKPVPMGATCPQCFVARPLDGTPCNTCK